MAKLLKAKLKSVDELVKLYEQELIRIDVGDLKYAGKEVVVENYYHEDDEDVNSLVITVEELGRCLPQEAFSSIPDSVKVFNEEQKLKRMNLLDSFGSIDGNDYVTFHNDGSFDVGCVTVDFVQLEALYNRAVEVKKKFAPKPRKKAKKKVSRKKK